MARFVRHEQKITSGALQIAPPFKSLLNYRQLKLIEHHLKTRHSAA
jgi:hypothetical protein